MCRFIILSMHEENGETFVVIYDKLRHYCFVDPFWKFNQRLSFYQKVGIKEKDDE